MSTTTQLIYNYFRDYDSAVGRYTQSDPIGLFAGPNTYAYGLANLGMSNYKLRFIDRSSGKRQPDLKRLIAYCNDSDPEVRMRALECLRSTKSFDQPDVFVMSAGDPDELVRIEALQALAVRKYAREFLPSFVSALSDKSELVAAYAADGLRVAASKSTRPLLERHLLHANGHARASILGALQTLGRRPALRELLDLLRSSNYQVTSFVANLLPELKLTDRERRTCVVALSRASTSVRSRAPREAIARALSHLRRRTSKAKSLDAER